MCHPRCVYKNIGKGSWIKIDQLMSLVLLFHYLLLNMFRMLVHPSSGSCDLLWIYFMGCIALVRSVLVLRYGSAGVVWYPYAGWSASASNKHKVDTVFSALRLGQQKSYHMVIPQRSIVLLFSCLYLRHPISPFPSGFLTKINNSLPLIRLHSSEIRNLFIPVIHCSCHVFYQW